MASGTLPALNKQLLHYETWLTQPIASPLAGRLADRFGARSVVRRAGAVVAALSALAFTRIGAHTNEVWPTRAALATGLGLDLVGAPTRGSLYRTLPAQTTQVVNEAETIVQHGRKKIHLEVARSR
jgi:MFS family permease